MSEQSVATNVTASSNSLAVKGHRVNDVWLAVGDELHEEWVSDSVETAPWLSRSEQEMILRALCNPDEDVLGDRLADIAIALLQSRLYPTTGDR